MAFLRRIFGLAPDELTDEHTRASVARRLMEQEARLRRLDAHLGPRRGR